MALIYKNRNQKVAKLIGAIYFLILGVLNFGATLIFAEIRILDIVILALACLPLLINRNYFYFSFGILAAIIALFLGYACLTFNLDPAIGTSGFSYFMGYLLSASLLVASFLLVYGGSQSHMVNVTSQQ